MADAFKHDPARDDMLILVDENDREIGTATKEQVHRDGLLHRAFSVLLTRGEGAGTEFLLARRASCKYHSGGLWANTCCSHPRLGEGVLDAAYRRVHEEVGCEAADLRELGAFTYRADVADGIVEHEADHVVVGACVGEPSPDPTEIEGLCWMGADEMRVMLDQHPEQFAAWAPQVLSKVLDSYSS